MPATATATATAAPATLAATASASPVIELKDVKVRALAKRVLHEFLVASEKAVASHAEPATFLIAPEPDSAEHIFRRRLDSFAADKRNAASVRVMALAKAPLAERKRYFGEMASLDLRSPLPIATQARALVLPASMKFPKSHLMTLGPPMPIIVSGGAIKPVTGNLAFRIHNVRCVDETNPEWFGNDEIGLGGVGIDETGEVAKIAESRVGNNFDDGDVRFYSPPMRFVSFNLNEGGDHWPKSYFVTLGLAEKDMGDGLDAFLGTLVTKIKERLVEVLGAAIGGVIGSLGGPLTAVVGAAVGWIIGKVYDWLKSWWNDDIFPPRSVSVTIGSLTHRWPGGTTDSPEGVVRFAAHGGTYDLTYDWAVYS